MLKCNDALLVAMLFLFCHFKETAGEPLSGPEILNPWVRGKNKLSQLIRRQEKKNMNKAAFFMSSACQVGEPDASGCGPETSLQENKNLPPGKVSDHYQ